MSKASHIHLKSKSLSKDNSLNRIISHSTLQIQGVPKGNNTKSTDILQIHRKSDSIVAPYREVLARVGKTVNTKKPKNVEIGSNYNSAEHLGQPVSPYKSAVSAMEFDHATFLKNYRSQRNLTKKTSKLFFRSQEDLHSESKEGISPPGSNYQTPRNGSMHVGNNYNVTYININKMDVNNFKLNEKNQSSINISQHIRKLSPDRSNTNLFSLQSTLKEKQIKIEELNRMILEMKTHIHQIVKEKERMHIEELSESLSQKNQVAELLGKVVTLCSRNNSIYNPSPTAVGKSTLSQNISQEKIIKDSESYQPESKQHIKSQPNLESSNKVSIVNLKIDLQKLKDPPNHILDNKQLSTHLISKHDESSKEMVGSESSGTIQLLTPGLYETTTTFQGVSPLIKNRSYVINERASGSVRGKTKKLSEDEDLKTSSSPSRSNSKLRFMENRRTSNQGLFMQHSLSQLSRNLSQTKEDSRTDINTSKLSSKASPHHAQTSAKSVKMSLTNICERFTNIMQYYQNEEKQLAIRNQDLFQKLNILVQNSKRVNTIT